MSFSAEPYLEGLPAPTPVLTSRQPVHTLYGGAHLFAPGLAAKLGTRALEALRKYGPPDGVSPQVAARVEAKLLAEPVEDFRIDFEDGLGPRSDAEEDRFAVAAAQALGGALPPFVGFRVRSLDHQTGTRCLRTLELFLRNVHSLPSNFRVTLPKIESPRQVESFVAALSELERLLGLPRIALEIMIETPAATQCLRQLRDAGDGRIVGAHLGAYDYLVLCGIPAQEQHLLHPLCDHLRAQMQAAYGATGIALVDGVTTVFPVPADMQTGWRVHMEHIRHSLSYGFYQSWDLHPAQLVSRYAAVYGHFESSQVANADRLRAFLASAAKAKLAGNSFDDVASAQGLLDYFLRARACQALTEEDIAAMTGLTAVQLETRSFARILVDRLGRSD